HPLTSTMVMDASAITAAIPIDCNNRSLISRLLPTPCSVRNSPARRVKRSAGPGPGWAVATAYQKPPRSNEWNWRAFLTGCLLHRPIARGYCVAFGRPPRRTVEYACGGLTRLVSAASQPFRDGNRGGNAG